MDLSEFIEKYFEYGSKERININCEDCENVCFPYKDNAQRIIKRRNKFICLSCAIKNSHKTSPRSKEVHKKISNSLLGVPKSNEARANMSISKKAFFESPAGEECKNHLSVLTSQGHQDNKYESKKRHGWFPSKKNDKLIFYGSSYELLACFQLDNDDAVESYQTQISYEWEKRGRCLDILINYKDGNKTAIEVKPETRLGEEEIRKQISDCESYAKSNGWNFELWTEKHFKMTYEEIRDWADEMRKTITGIDYPELRKENNRKKAKKYYHEKIATNTVNVFCEYCNLEHTALKLTYDKNIARNGRYICEREGGSIAGKKPKKKLENPYAVDGKKKCLNCESVKLLEEFGNDKTRSDGKSTRCKKCRAEIAVAKYRDSKK